VLAEIIVKETDHFNPVLILNAAQTQKRQREPADHRPDRGARDNAPQRPNLVICSLRCFQLQVLVTAAGVAAIRWQYCGKQLGQRMEHKAGSQFSLLTREAASRRRRPMIALHGPIREGTALGDRLHFPCPSAESAVVRREDCGSSEGKPQTMMAAEDVHATQGNRREVICALHS